MSVRVGLQFLSIILTLALAQSRASSAPAYAAANQSPESAAAQAPEKEKIEEVNRQAFALFQAGNLDKALETFSQALELCRRAKNPADEAHTLSSIGLVYSAKQDWGKARECFQQALTFFQSRADRANEAQLLARIAFTFDGEKNPKAALVYYRQAIPLLRAEGDRARDTLALILLAAGNDARALGEKHDALQLLLSSLPLWQRAKNPELEAAALESIAFLYGELGDSREELSHYERALVAWDAARNQARRAGVHGVIAGIELVLGNHEKALRHYNESLSIWRALGETALQARLLSKIGDFYVSLGDFPRATSYYREALSLSESLDDSLVKATLLEDIGRLYAYQRAHSDAMRYFDQSLALWRRLGRADGEANILAMMGKFCDWAGDYQRAAEYLNQSLPLWRKAKILAGEVEAMSSLGMVYAMMIALHIPSRSPEEIPTYLDQTLRRIQDISDPQVKSILLGRISLAHLMLGNLERAVEYSSQALELSENSRDQNGMAIALFNLGLAYESKGKIPQALEFYERAIDIRDRVRSSAHLEEIKTGLSGLMSDAYAHAALLRIETGAYVRSFELTERARARTLLDQLANLRPRSKEKAGAGLLKEEQDLRSELALLENRVKLESSKIGLSFDRAAIASLQTRLASKKSAYEDLLTRLKLADPEYASLRTVSTLTLPEVQALIGKNTTLISYFVMEKLTLAFVITHDTFHPLALGTGEAELKKEIDWFRKFASVNGPAPEGLKRLYEKLILPLDRYIKTSSVGIIPHGVLNYLPFAALTDGQQYFGERHAVYYLPSASVLRFIQRRGGPVRNSIMAVAQSRATGHPALRYADEEIAAIAALFHTKAHATGEISKAALLKLAGDYSVVHVAAHGELDPSNPLFSRIWLAPDENSEGALAVHEVYDMALTQTDLVVLSACETQLGAHSQGDDIVGLNRAFIYAGASTVIASLWTVDDRATGLLMRSFYTHLKRGNGKAEALRMAQSETRRQYPSPYYWAAFVLTGDAGSGNRPRSAGRLAGAVRHH